MSPAEVVRAMAAAGASPEAIAIALDAIDAERAKAAEARAKRAAARKRQRHDRDMAATVARHVGDMSATVADEVSPRFAPLDNNQPPTPTPSGKKTPARASDWPRDAFRQWYALYPRKKAPADAERAFRKIEAAGQTSFAALMAGTRRLVDSDPDPNFIPYPATWLNAGQWDDEPDQPAKPKTTNGNHHHAADVVSAGGRVAERLRAALDPGSRGECGYQDVRLLEARGRG